jgi:flavin-dependent dehydrogenase
VSEGIAPAEYVDVVVVGARVAGATLAALLGDAGARVLLVDRASFPSATLSTHFFGGGHAVSVFRRLGVLDRLLALGAPPLRCEYTYVDDDAAEVGPPQDPGDVGYSLSVRREALDDVLVRRAAGSPVVELAERTRLDDLLRRDGRVIGAVIEGPRGRRAVGARVVVGADGRRSKVAKLVGADDQERRSGARALYYRYVRDFASPAEEIGAEFSPRGDEIAYVFPSDDGFACVAVSSPKSLFSEFRVSPSAMLDARIGQHSQIAERYEAAQRDGTVLGTAPEDNYVRIPFGEGWHSSETPGCTWTRGAAEASTWPPCAERCWTSYCRRCAETRTCSTCLRATGHAATSTGSTRGARRSRWPMTSRSCLRDEPNESESAPPAEA